MKDLKEFLCFVCHQKAKSQKLLDGHIRKDHKGVSLYSCPCDKSFSSKQAYEDHLNCRHFYKYTFKCEKGCTREFTTSSARRMHHNKFHSSMSFVCFKPSCGQSFSKSHLLKQHMREDHGIVEFKGFEQWG